MKKIVRFANNKIHYYTHPPISSSSHFTPYVTFFLFFFFFFFFFLLDLTSSPSPISIPSTDQFFRHGSASCQEGRRLWRWRYLLITSPSLDYQYFLSPILLLEFDLVVFWKLWIGFNIYLPLICFSIVELSQISLIFVILVTFWSSLLIVFDIESIRLVRAWIDMYVFFLICVDVIVECYATLYRNFMDLPVFLCFWSLHFDLHSFCYSILTLGGCFCAFYRGIFSVFGDWERYCSSGSKGIQWSPARHKEMLPGICFEYMELVDMF